MFDIFVSYRSADAPFCAAATYELLAHRFGKDRIFLDNQSMGPGSTYPQQLREALESMRVLLVLIGPQWLAADPVSPGHLLIQHRDDWVRREIRHAFARSVLVIPVLLDGARLPDADLLPGDVQPLVYCQTAEVRHRHLGTDINQLANQLRDQLFQAPSSGTNGHRWSRVHEIDDPVSLGVHPSPAHAEPIVSSSGDPSLRVPRYVPRDVTERLAWALTNTSFLLIVGDATAGKSRIAYEVVRERLPNHWFVNPAGTAGLSEALAWIAHADDCVVWLDDIERYLGPAGLTVHVVATLTARRAGHVVLVGTIRSQEHARFIPRCEDRIADEPGRLQSRLGRDVLRLAHEIHLSRLWSGAEIRRASASTDPRVTEAARHAGEFGIAEYLAAGPQLLAEWRDAWSPGSHPRAAALVAAAVDASRAGAHRGVGIDLLRRLHGQFLAIRGGDALRPETFDEALSWATERLHATSSLLVPTGRGRYRPFAYLIDATDADPEQPAVQDRTWQILVTRMPATECWHIGEAAYAYRQLSYAQAAFERAATAGNRSAELKVADCIGESGRHGEALAALRTVIDVQTRSAGPRHPDTLEARQALAGWTGRAGDPRAAVRLISDVVDDLTAIAGPQHADTLAARHALANWMGRAGRLGDAVAEFQLLVEDQTQHNGSDHPNTLTARHELANWLGRTGKATEAQHEHEEVAATRTRVLGADHRDTLRSRHRLARIICEVRGTDVGLPLLARVVAHRTRVLGPDHPDTLRSRSQYARWTGKAGRFDEAAAQFEQVIEASARRLGVEHPDTLRARHQHARWISEAGKPAQAVLLLRDLIADWTRLLGPRHPYTLSSRYRLALAVAGTGAQAEAIAQLVDLLANDIATLGEGHPYTRHTQNLMTQWKNAPRS